MLRCALLIFFHSFSFPGYTQEIAMGDSSIVNPIKRKTSLIYGSQDSTVFLLTKQPLQKIKSCGTSIVVYLKNGSINQIVTSATTLQGILSAEYYFDHEQLIFSYITFEYFDEAKTIINRKNFKGLRSWESRYYFTNEKIRYQSHSGIRKKSAIYSSNQVKSDVQKILKYTRNRMKQ
jgi:hypothetical protein